MIIVQGVFRVDPAERDAYLSQSVEGMQMSRAEHGCLEYVMAADPVEADRVILSERWESREDLDRHIDGLTRLRKDTADSADAQAVSVVSRELAMYEVTSAKPLG